MRPTPICETLALPPTRAAPTKEDIMGWITYNNYDGSRGTGSSVEEAKADANKGR